MTAPGRVAIVKLSALGDVVHALPVAVALKRAWPATHLTWVVERRVAAVLAGHAAIDDVVEVDTRAWRRTRTPAQAASVVRELRAVRAQLAAQRIDVALDLQGLLKSGVLTRATGARRRIGFAARVSKEPLSALFVGERVMPDEARRHVVDRYLAILQPLGVAPGAVQFDLAVDAGAEARIDEFFGVSGLKPHRRLVVLNPGAGRENKRWPVDRFRALAERLRHEANAAVVVVWGPSEHDAARAIADVPGARPVLAPATNVADLAALLRRASVMVAADTGPLHVAAAVRTPCVGLYGPTVGTRNGPYGSGHRVLQSTDGAMTGITVTAAFDAVTALLGG